MPVSVSVFSDLHLEFGDLNLTHVDSDVIILAGDIFIKIRSVEWIQKQFGDRDVILIDGNHEFYGSNIDSVRRKTREATKGTNIHYLENNYVDIKGIRFIGSTLWTDFNIFGNPTLAKNMSAALMNDYKKIRIEKRGSYRMLRPDDTHLMHKVSRTFIATTIDESPLPTVVVSHHAPSMKSVGSEYKKETVTAAYASDLEQFMEDHPSLLWVHGHTHKNVDYLIGQTRVIANQRGYVGLEPNPQFNPRHKIILDV